MQKHELSLAMQTAEAVKSCVMLNRRLSVVIHALFGVKCLVLRSPTLESGKECLEVSRLE